jgi:DNA repair photolyase
VAALKRLSQRGLLTGITLMPVLPFIEDTQENIRAIIRMAQAAGARYILPAFGMTLRDRQRAYYYDKLDRLFPGLRARYEKAFGERYSAPARNARQLGQVFAELCEQLEIATKIPVFAPQKRVLMEKNQLPLF